MFLSLACSLLASVLPLPSSFSSIEAVNKNPIQVGTVTSPGLAEPARNALMIHLYT